MHRLIINLVRAGGIGLAVYFSGRLYAGKRKRDVIKYMIRQNEVERAAKAGKDVCRKCWSIEPHRCEESHCMNCEGVCPKCNQCGKCTGQGSRVCSDCY